jgi:hypothetical protein
MDDFGDSDDYGDSESIVDDFAFLKPSLRLSDNSPGLRCEVKAYEARYNHRGERNLLGVGTSGEREPKGHQDKDSALVFTRWYNRESEIESTNLVIRSPYINHALKEVIKEYPGINFKTATIQISGLPKCIFHYRDELQAFGLLQDSEDVKHIVLLLRHMWEQLESQCDSYHNLMESPRLAPGLEFANLWMAFRPGDYLYMQVQTQHRIVKMTTMRNNTTGAIIDFVYIADDGKKVGYVQGDCEIETYEGYRPLANLKIFPLEYHLEKESIREETIARGRKMMTFRGVHYQMYEDVTEALGKTRRTTFLGQVDTFPLQTTAVRPTNLSLI